MPIFDNRRLRQEADTKLRSAPNRGKLILLFAGVAAGLSLAAGIVSMLLDSQIAGAGGLAGLRLRSTLSTVQAMLNIVILAFIPFWNLGYTSVALKLGRGEAASETDLLDGLRRFGPALRLMLLRLVVSFAVGFAAVQVASIAFSMTPWAVPFYQQLDNAGLMDPSGVMDEATMAALLPTMIPLWILIVALLVAAMIPVSYRLRLSELCLMDDPQCGALLAMFQSNRMMKGNCMALFRLDLHFWWYYLAQVLVTALCYGDVLLPLLGIQLPFSPEVSFLLFYVLAQGAQILLYWRCRNLVECTYVGAYDILRTAPEPQPQPPKNVPWNY